MLRHHAAERPESIFLAERVDESWRHLSYADALSTAESIAQSLIDRGLSAQRPLLILSGNSIDHALMLLGAMLVGVPVAPISPAYSLMSKDYGKLRQILELVRPGIVFAAPMAPFVPVLKALDLDGVELAGSGPLPRDLSITPFSELASTTPGSAAARAEAEVGPDTVAKILFTSGSTGLPKGVLNTQRMLCANQQMLEQCWPFVKQTPPVLVDWLPWNHTFGGNHNFNLVLKQGGTLWIDGGKPAPGLIELTLANLREISPSLYFNVPAGYAQLVPHLENDRDLRDHFFRDLQLLFYAAAALPEDLWKRLGDLSEQARGERVVMASGWGSTETAPLSTSVHFPTESAASIGLPPPGVELKLVPAGPKTELRVRGPHVTPGYLGRNDLTAAAFDDDGFYKIGDAGRLADPKDPTKGLVFDGRVAEDFKLSSGTWVRTGALRVKALAATSPALQDALVTGHDRDYIGLLAWPNVSACESLVDDPDAAGDATRLIRSSQVVDCVRSGLERYNAEHPGSSTRIRRVILLAEPPDIDANEITDKGYVNQQAALERRKATVERLYRDPPETDVILIDSEAVEWPLQGRRGQMLLIRVSMGVRSIIRTTLCSALVLSCSQAAESEPDVAAPVPTAAESETGWPETIVAERGSFIPEGVEYDQTHERILVGSVADGSVYQLERDGSLTPLVEDPDLISSVGIEVDEARGRLLVANSDASVFASGTGQAKLGVFESGSGERLAMVDLAVTIEDRTEETAFFANDVTVDDQGNIYVSDSRTGAIYVVDEAYEPSLLHRFETSEAFIPNGLVAHPSGYLLVAGRETLYKVPLDDPASASQVSLPEPISGADGVVWTSDEHLAIVANRQNRVVVFTSADDWATAELVGVARYEVMATTVAVIGVELYVVHPHFQDDGEPSVERVRFE